MGKQEVIVRKKPNAVNIYPSRGSDFLFPMSTSQVENQLENTVNWVGHTVYMYYLRRK